MMIAKIKNLLIRLKIAFKGGKNLTEKEIMFMLGGALKTLIKDKTYFYYSSIGISYCHLTDEGRRAVAEMVDMLAPKLFEAMHKDDIERSKQLMMDELKRSE